MSIHVDFAEPISFGALVNDKQEVIFTDPLALDPNVAIVEPGIIRVLVNVKTKAATLVPDM